MEREDLLKEINSKIITKSGKVDGNIHNPKSKSHCPELLEKIDEYTKDFKDAPFKEKIFIIKNDIKERPRCYCGNENIFKNNVVQYTEYCSAKCQRTSPKRLENIKEKWANKTKEEKDTHVKRNKESKLRNHGNENYNNHKKISETYLSKPDEYWEERNSRQRATKLEKYGDENYCNKEKILETKANFSEEKKEAIIEKRKDTCVEKYGTTSPLQSPEIKEKIKQIHLDKYGVEHPMKNKEFVEKLIQRKIENGTHPSNPLIHEKAKQTNIEKYGAITFTSSPEGKEQVFNTKLERYGSGTYCNSIKVSETLKSKTDEEWSEIINRRKETCMNNFGYIHQMNCPEIKEKLINTKIENGTHPSSLEVREKSSKTWQAKSDKEIQEINQKKLTTGVKTKTYIMPSGKEVLYQGYENFAIDVLLKRFSEDDLDIHPNISIPYIHKNKKRRYLPDILIKSSNTIIEVKSTWTYEKDLEVNKLKEQACLNNGYNFKFIILTDKKEIKIYE